MIFKEFDCTRIRLAVGVFLIDKENKNIHPETAVSNANLANAKENSDIVNATPVALSMTVTI